MLELTMGGRCIGGLDALAFLEALPDSIPEKVKTDEFCRNSTFPFRVGMAKGVGKA